jgi:hypothetical protein
MKSLITTALVVLGLLSTAVIAQATSYKSQPEWAKRAFPTSIH